MKMGYRFNPPPNWPAPPLGWVPVPGWRPSPEWPVPPPGWQLWVDDTALAPNPVSKRPQHQVDPSGWLPTDRVNRHRGAHKNAGTTSHNSVKRLGTILAEHKIWTGVGAFIALSVIVYAANPHATNGGAHPKSTPAVPAVAPATPRPVSTTPRPVSATSAPATAASSTTARKPSFPPRTLAAFRAFADSGDASEVHQVGSSTEGLPSCPVPNIYVTVSPGLTTRELEADLSAFFAQSGLLNNQCQAFVFAFHSRSDYQANSNNGYTAGRVALTMNSGSGPQHNLEVDAGDVYDFPAQFDLNF
jgi:hypothetical protein